MGDRAHERLIGITQMAVDHVEMPLVHRQVDRLTYRTAGVVHCRRHVGELYEVAEILDCGVAAALVQTADEGRTIDRREHRVLTADIDVARRIAGMLHILPRRALLDNGSRQTTGKMNAGASDVGTSSPPQLQSLRILYA